jgi:hypothetical protein
MSPFRTTFERNALLALCLALASSVALAQSGPTPPTPAVQAANSSLPPEIATFGFTPGETREQIIAAVGKINVFRISGDNMQLLAAPRSSQSFETFILVVPPKFGLVKILASGKDIEHDAEGKQLRGTFDTLQQEIAATFGPPSSSVDALQPDSKLKKPKNFMMALALKERTLAAYWMKKDLGQQITSISLECVGQGADQGYVSLEYEFAGYRDYALAKTP